MTVGMSELVAIALRLPEIIAEAMAASDQRKAADLGWRQVGDPRRQRLGGGSCRVRRAASCQ